MVIDFVIDPYFCQQPSLTPYIWPSWAPRLNQGALSWGRLVSSFLIKWSTVKQLPVRHIQNIPLHSK